MYSMIPGAFHWHLRNNLAVEIVVLWCTVCPHLTGASDDFSNSPEVVDLKKEQKSPLVISVTLTEIYINDKQFAETKELIAHLSAQQAGAFSDGILVSYESKVSKVDPFPQILDFAKSKHYDLFMKTALGKRIYREHEATWVVKQPRP